MTMIPLKRSVDFKTKDVEFLGANFEAFKGGSVKVDVTNVTGFGTLFSEIENDSRLGLGLFDACEYIINCTAHIYSNIELEKRFSHITHISNLYPDVTPPVIMGTAVQYEGFADMTEYIT